MRMGTPRSLASWRHLLDLRLLAQVAGVEPQALDPRLQGGERHLVVEVDVGDDRHRRPGDDVGQPLGRLLLVAGAAHDVGPGGGQRVDLGQGALDVGGLGVVIDCTEMGAPPPTATGPTWIWRVGRRAAAIRWDGPSGRLTCLGAGTGPHWNGLASGG